MKIGIDISQLAFTNTGVANYLKNLVEHLLVTDTQNEYVLFFSSLRRELPASMLWTSSPHIRIHADKIKAKSVTIKQFKFPPIALDMLWNRFHIFPIEQLIGNVDIFISSDWTQPPSKAKKITILYDLIVYKYPEETAKRIIATQKRKLRWSAKECDKILCISEATKKDAMSLLQISPEKLAVIVPGIN